MKNLKPILFSAIIIVVLTVTGITGCNKNKNNNNNSAVSGKVKSKTVTAQLVTTNYTYDSQGRITLEQIVNNGIDSVRTTYSYTPTQLPSFIMVPEQLHHTPLMLII